MARNLYMAKNILTLLLLNCFLLMVGCSPILTQEEYPTYLSGIKTIGLCVGVKIDTNYYVGLQERKWEPLIRNEINRPGFYKAMDEFSEKYANKFSNVAKKQSYYLGMANTVINIFSKERKEKFRQLELQKSAKLM